MQSITLCQGFIHKQLVWSQWLRLSFPHLSSSVHSQIWFNSTELPVPLEINFPRKVMASANCDSSFGDLTIFVCGVRFLEFLIPWCLNWLHYLQPHSVFTCSCSSPVVRGVQLLGRAKLEWGPATVCLYFSKLKEVPLSSHESCVDADGEMHQHAEIWPLAQMGITNTFVTGGWEREVVLVEVAEEFHSRELKHLAFSRGHGGMVVKFSLGLGVYKPLSLSGSE